MTDESNDLAILQAAMAAILDEIVDGCCDIEGGWLQEQLLASGVLMRVEVTEPCGEWCQCREWDDFPQTCVRHSPVALRAIRSVAVAKMSNESQTKGTTP